MAPGWGELGLPLLDFKAVFPMMLLCDKRDWEPDVVGNKRTLVYYPLKLAENVYFSWAMLYRTDRNGRYVFQGGDRPSLYNV